MFPSAKRSYSASCRDKSFATLLFIYHRSHFKSLCGRCKSRKSPAKRSAYLIFPDCFHCRGCTYVKPLLARYH